MSKIDIIIPTLNASEYLERTISSIIKSDFINKIYLVDALSTDNTVSIANKLNLETISSKIKGRGNQLYLGATIAKADWLLFLHADSYLEDGWVSEVNKIINDNQMKKKAHYFTFKLDDSSDMASKLESRVLWRNEKLSLPYGDQCLLIHRVLYDHIGGYKQIELFEDVDIIRRLGKNRINRLSSKCITSAQKYIKSGYKKRMAKNVLCLFLYYLKIPVPFIKRIYNL